MKVRRSILFLLLFACHVSSQRQTRKSPRPPDRIPPPACPGPPSDVIILNFLPVDWIVRDNEGNVLESSEFSGDPVPSAPPVFTVGVMAKPPPGYESQLMERYSINLKADGTSSLQKALSTGTEDMRMVDAFNNSSMDSIQIMSSSVLAPYFTAPFNGPNNPKFVKGLERRNRAFNKSPSQSPITGLMTDFFSVFNKLSELEEQGHNQWPHNRRHHDQECGEPWSWPWPWRKATNRNVKVKSCVATPIAVAQIQRYTVPEPNSAEGIILDATFNFGPQANRMKFGDVDLFTSTWTKMKNNSLTSLETQSFGKSLLSFQSSMNVKLQSYVKSLRKATAKSYEEAEESHYANFIQRQYFVHPPHGGCKIPLDWPRGRGTTSNMCSIGAVNFNFPAPRCFPPAC